MPNNHAACLFPQIVFQQTKGCKPTIQSLKKHINVNFWIIMFEYFWWYLESFGSEWIIGSPPVDPFLKQLLFGQATHPNRCCSCRLHWSTQAPWLFRVKSGSRAFNQKPTGKARFDLISELWLIWFHTIWFFSHRIRSDIAWYRCRGWTELWSLRAALRRSSLAHRSLYSFAVASRHRIWLRCPAAPEFSANFPADFQLAERHIYLHLARYRSMVRKWYSAGDSKKSPRCSLAPTLSLRGKGTGIKNESHPDR